MSGAVFPAPSCAHFSPREENPSSPRGGHLFGVFFGWWWLGVPAGLTEPLSGHGALLRGAGGDRACLTGRGWSGRCARNTYSVIYFTVCKLNTYETYHSAP